MVTQIRNTVPAEGTEPWRMINSLQPLKQLSRQDLSKHASVSSRAGPPVGGGIRLSAPTS